MDDAGNYFSELCDGGADWGDEAYATSIAFGDVDGDSLLVGEPRHSVQTISDQVIAVINAPPKQRDVNYEDDQYKITYKAITEDRVVESVQAKLGWAVTSKVKAKVGSVPHPMEQKHYIEWIEIIADGKTCRKFLKPGDKPEADFEITAEKIEAREYCNIHGLWKSK